MKNKLAEVRFIKFIKENVGLLIAALLISIGVNADFKDQGYEEYEFILNTIWFLFIFLMLRGLFGLNNKI